ncbi:MAG: tetratricopeptide repeat protein [Clostridia bacterium]|nr:tetratricopeptide repeat protein [Clostridia bacterium]
MKSVIRAILCLLLAVSLAPPAHAEYWGDMDPEPVYSPDMPEYHWKAGNSYYHQGEYDLALASYTRAIEINASFSNAFHGLAFTYRAMGRLDLALDNYDEVIRLIPDYAQPYMKRAEIYQFLGRTEEAERDLNLFVKHYGQYPAAYLTRGDFYMTKNAYDRAAVDYALALERNPNLLTAFVKYAEALLLAGYPEEASAVFERAATIADGPAPASARTGEIGTIELRLSPSFGMEGEMNDTVVTLCPTEELTALIHANDFFNMPETIETGVLDGHYTRITVCLKNGESKTVGGLVAEEFGPDAFIAVYDAIVLASNAR